MSGRLGSELRPVPAFREIRLQSNATVYVTIADSESVRVEADEHVLGLMTTACPDGVLTIGTVPGVCADGSLPMTVYVTVPTLRSVEVDGSGRVIVAGRVVGDSLRLIMSGAGVIDIDAETKTLMTTTVTGSGRLSLRGTAALHEMDHHGGGVVSAFDLLSKEAKVLLSGSGVVRLTVQNAFRVAVTGSGSVEYRGEPIILDVQVSGSGRVVKVR